MIARVAVVPHPPLLVPELSPAAGAQAEAVRKAVREAGHWLAEVASDWLAVAADGSAPTAFGVECAGSWASFGAQLPVTLSQHSGAHRELPLPILVAGWLRGEVGARSVRGEVAASTATPAECAALGRRLAREAGERAVLVLGDGAICHGTAAPGRADERAAGFDAAAGSALGTADQKALDALDPVLSDELGATGRVAWQIASAMLGARTWRASLRYSGAPFGVGYHVALWEAA